MFAALVKKELLALSRDAHGLAALFLMPMLFIVIMSLALKNVYDPPQHSQRYAIEQHDRGALAQSLRQAWVKEQGDPQELPEQWEAEVRAGRLDYVLVIAEDFSAAILKDELGTNVKVLLQAKPQIDVAQFNQDKSTLVQMLVQIRAQALLQIAKAQQMRPPGAARSAPGKAAGTPAGTVPSLAVSDLVRVERLSSGSRPTAVQQNVPAWLMFGMFFVVASVANVFIQERESGALTRLFGLGVPAPLMLAGKAFTYMGVNAVQAMLMLMVGVWLMPLLGGDALSLSGISWAGLLLMLTAISVAAVGLAMALATVAKTHAQAAAVGPILNVLMAAIGGVMVPTFVMPQVMQNLSAWSPMNWGLNGMLAVLLNGQNAAGAWPQAAKLLAFGGVMFAVAVLFFRRGSK